MASIPAEYAGQSSALDTATFQRSVRLSYGAFASAGTQSLLIAQQAQATPRQFLLLGNASTGMSSTIANKIVADPNDQLITSPYQSQRANLATGMVTYFTAVPAAADGAYCYAFAIGGLQCSDFYEVVLRCYRRTSTTAVNPSDFLKNINQATVVGGTSLVQPGNQAAITLDGSSRILQRDGTTPIVYGTNTIVMAPNYGVIFGAINITDVTDVANSGDLLELEVYFK